MIHWLKAPKNPEIAKYIECYWFLEKLPGAEGNAQPKLNPDPSAHLILALPQQRFQYQYNDDISNVTGNHWLHAHGKTFVLDHSKAVACIGIKFHVGALYSLPNLITLKEKTSQALIDTIHEVSFDQTSSDYANHNGINIDENALLNMARIAPEQCATMLDNLCLPWLLNTNEDNHSEITRRVLPLLAKITINELGTRLFCSQRTLERSFLKVTGLTLKQCQSMNRLEAILAFLYQRPQNDIDWVDIAYQFGFSDQPHLIRYLKKQIGLTPQDYASQRGFTIDVYGGVDQL
ncbi:helix-turn-helix transcriptional regulator [Colwellia piezophila]|uniref:helix-turn-helix transcriptional regulator n=1 Tax=Colwellia piezophila TaxID=211668 RepID=UPI00037D318C|nr:helix-turn-helix transcriptional regulator [Colwellia piezophila]